jgi:rhodanese-related sulfurtransferase
MSEYIVLGVLAVLFGAFWYLKRPDISPLQAHELVARGGRLVDVRSPGEYARAHVDGALNLPVGEVAGRARELGPKDRPIILYCASGTRSAMAARTLRSFGFTKVYNLGSMGNW